MPKFPLRGVSIEFRQWTYNAVGVLDAVDVGDEMRGGERAERWRTRDGFITGAAFGIEGGRAQNIT